MHPTRVATATEERYQRPQRRDDDYNLRLLASIASLQQSNDSNKRLETARNDTRLGGEHVLLNKLI